MLSPYFLFINQVDSTMFGEVISFSFSLSRRRKVAVFLFCSEPIKSAGIVNPLSDPYFTFARLTIGRFESNTPF